MKNNKTLLFVILMAMINISYGQNSVPATEMNGIIKKSGIIRKNFTPPPPNWRLNPQTSDIIVDYQGTWTTQAQTAFEFAVDLWEQGITSTVPIRIIAKFEYLDPGIIGGTNLTGFLWYNFTAGDGEIVTPNMNYPQALANKLSHTDLAPDINDFTITMSSNASSINFYYGTDGNVPTNQIDFVSTVLHEIAHGLGFWSSLRMVSGQANYRYSNGFPIIFDTFIRNGNVWLTSLSSPSSALSSFAISDNLFFDGFNTNAGNGGTAAPLFAPNPFQSGSSISHLRENSYPNNPPNPNRLMTPYLDYGEAIHDIGYVSHGIMSDLRWDMESWVGIEDHIELLAPIPVLLTQGQQYIYRPTFIDNIPLGAWMNSYNWKIELLTNTQPFTLIAANTPDLWTFSLPSLPVLIDGYYLRNYDGTVRAKLKVFGNDNQGVYHEFSQDLSIKYLPDPPLLQKVSSSCTFIKVSFFSQGATSYVLYYGTSSGVPYSNTVNISPGINTYTISLPYGNNTYYVNAKGVNQAGSSVYANEVSRTCNTDPIDSPQLTELFGSSNDLNFEVFPNPCNNFITVSAVGNTYYSIIKIFASNGQLVYEKNVVNSNNTKIDVEKLKPGIYLIELSTSNGKSAQQKFLKSN
jgi:hypothetical protein